MTGTHVVLLIDKTTVSVVRLEHTNYILPGSHTTAVRNLIPGTPPPVELTPIPYLLPDM